MAQYTRDESVAVRQDLNIDEKVQIGKYASSLIEKDDFVYIDAGTTTDFLIDFLTVAGRCVCDKTESCMRRS